MGLGANRTFPNMSVCKIYHKCKIKKMIIKLRFIPQVVNVYIFLAKMGCPIKMGVHMVRMRTILKAVIALVLACVVNTFAEDIVATASNGAAVILHDNGRWEYYQNNTKIRDIRQSAIPEDAKFNVMVEYETPERVRNNVRLAMEAEFATEEEIKDSLRKVPKGGYIYFQVKTSQIKKGMPRKLTYSLYDGSKTPIFRKTAYDTEAVPSEQSGVSNLLVVPVYGHPKSDVMLASVEALDGMETLDIDIPVR